MSLILKGSWVVMSGVISRVTISITHNRGPPGCDGQRSAGPGKVLPGLGREIALILGLGFRV